MAIAKCLHLCPLSNYRGVKSATSVFQYCVKLCFFLLQINCKLYDNGTHCAGIRRHMWSYVIRGELEIMMMKIGWYWKWIETHVFVITILLKFKILTLNSPLILKPPQINNVWTKDAFYYKTGERSLIKFYRIHHFVCDKEQNRGCGTS